MKYIKLFESYNTNTYKVYHGASVEFKEFSYDMINTGTGSSWNGYGFYFTDNKKEADLYGDIIIEALITLNKPLDLTKVEDFSISGSGLVRLLSSFDVFKSIKYKGYSYQELYNILNEIESNFNFSDVYYTNGNNKMFKHVWYETDGEEYVLYNKTENEINDKKYLKNLLLSNVLYKKCDITSLPIRISETMSSRVFSDEIEKLGYDGIIADNSLLSGKEYVVFDRKNIEII